MLRSMDRSLTFFSSMFLVTHIRIRESTNERAKRIGRKRAQQQRSSSKKRRRQEHGEKNDDALSNAYKHTHIGALSLSLSHTHTDTITPYNVLSLFRLLTHLSYTMLPSEDPSLTHPNGGATGWKKSLCMASIAYYWAPEESSTQKRASEHSNVEKETVGAL